MSREYDLYLQDHKENVFKGLEWIHENLPEVLDECPYPFLEQQIRYDHDASKSEPSEYDAYDNYFYGESKTDEVAKEFNLAWLRHIHRNKHHWQHWVLINDDPGEGMIVLDMPHHYILEMICDWWAFSWKKYNESGEYRDLYEIFVWYNKHKDYMKLGDKTRKTVDDILDKIGIKLSELEEKEK